MKNYTSEEIQEISANFRNVARRLSRTDYSQCDANLKRFMSLIDEQEMIHDFIKKNYSCKYDIVEIIKTRDGTSPFEISPVKEEEISLDYQMLKYSINNFDGDFTRLYGTYWYTSTQSTIYDEMKKFVEHIIDPLIDYISDYLRICYAKKLREEEKDQPKTMGGITANNSTVVVANNIDGTISNNININEETKKDALELVNSIRDSFSANSVDDESDILELLKQIESDIKENNKPKKGFFTALKNLCGGSAAIITLINALMKIFGFT